MFGAAYTRLVVLAVVRLKDVGAKVVGAVLGLAVVRAVLGLAVVGLKDVGGEVVGAVLGLAVVGLTVVRAN